jgi:hypothetical protein
MATIVNRLWDRCTRQCRPVGAKVCRRPHLEIEALESRWAPAGVGLALVPRPVVEVNPQPLPPGAIVQFDAQPVFSKLIPPGPPTFTDVSFQLNGQFSESGQQIPPGPTTMQAGPTQSWSLTAVYSLEVHVQETLVPPGPPIAPAGPTAIPPGPPIIPGTLDITYSVEGSVDSVLTVTQMAGTGTPAAPAAPQDVTIGRELLFRHGAITGTIAPADATGGQQITFIANAETTHETSGQTRKLIGRTKYPNITLERGIARVQSLWNWDETLKSSPASDAVAAIDASFSGTDQLDQALLILAPLHPPNPCFIAAALSGTGSLHENLQPPGPPIAPGLPGFVLNGSFQDQGDLNETITLLSAPTFHVDNVFAAAGSLNQTGVVLPPQPVNPDTPVPLAPSGLVFTSTPTFSWTAVAGATHYSVWIEDLNTGGVIFAPYVTGTSLPSSLTAGDTYAWSVQALDDIGDASAVSQVMVFTIVQAKGVAPRPVAGG